MAEIAEEMGVTIHTGTPVEEILMDGRNAVGVRTEHGVHMADNVVVNADFAKAMVDLVPNSARRKWTDEKLEKKGYSCSTFMLYLGCATEHGRPRTTSIYASSNYLSNLEDIENHRVTWEDPSVYVQNACVTDPQLAPEGGSTILCARPRLERPRERGLVGESPMSAGSSFSTRWRTNSASMASADRIVTERAITPEDWGEVCYRGAVFNLKHGLDQMLFRRPKNRFGEIGNMYLVGGGTHPGSGLPSHSSNPLGITSKLLLNDLGITPDWNGVDSWFEDMPRPGPRRRVRSSKIALPRQPTPKS